MRHTPKQYMIEGDAYSTFRGKESRSIDPGQSISGMFFGIIRSRNEIPRIAGSLLPKCFPDLCCSVIRSSSSSPSPPPPIYIRLWWNRIRGTAEWNRQIRGIFWQRRLPRSRSAKITTLEFPGGMTWVYRPWERICQHYCDSEEPWACDLSHFRNWVSFRIRLISVRWNHWNSYDSKIYIILVKTIHMRKP